MKKYLLIFLFIISVSPSVYAGVDPVFYSENTLAVEQQQGKSVIYPNPAREFTTVKSNNKIKTVTVVSVVGNIVINESLNGNSEIELNVSKLKSGKYFVKITYLDGSQDILNLFKL